MQHKRKPMNKNVNYAKERQHQHVVNLYLSEQIVKQLFIFGVSERECTIDFKFSPLGFSRKSVIRPFLSAFINPKSDARLHVDEIKNKIKRQEYVSVGYVNRKQGHSSSYKMQSMTYPKLSSMNIDDGHKQVCSSE